MPGTRDAPVGPPAFVALGDLAARHGCRVELVQGSLRPELSAGDYVAYDLILELWGPQGFLTSLTVAAESTIEAEADRLLRVVRWELEQL